MHLLTHSLSGLTAKVLARDPPNDQDVSNVRVILGHVSQLLLMQSGDVFVKPCLRMGLLKNSYGIRRHLTRNVRSWRHPKDLQTSLGRADACEQLH